MLSNDAVYAIVIGTVMIFCRNQIVALIWGHRYDQTDDAASTEDIDDLEERISALEKTPREDAYAAEDNDCELEKRIETLEEVAKCDEAEQAHVDTVLALDKLLTAVSVAADGIKYQVEALIRVGRMSAGMAAPRKKPQEEAKDNGKPDGPEEKKPLRVFLQLINTDTGSITFVLVAPHYHLLVDAADGMRIDEWDNENEKVVLELRDILDLVDDGFTPEVLGQVVENVNNCDVLYTIRYE